LTRRRRAGLATALMSLAAAAAHAQSNPEEQARRLLEDGRGYMRAGQTKQAVDNFNTIVTGFSATDSVDDALLEIGRYHVEVAGEPEKAREAFEQVAKRYPQSDGAPGAYYYLGRLALERATTAAELDDALAQFARVGRLYPRSAWVARALFGAALAQRKAGRLPEALEAARRVSLEYPSSDAAPEALFQAGHVLALMGEPRQAMEEFQRIRNRFPESAWAPLALDRTTALYRLFGAGKPVFALDAGYQVGAGDLVKDVRAILMTPSRTLWVASDKAKTAASFGPDGKQGPGHGGVDLRSITLGARGDVVITARSAVRVAPRDLMGLSVPGDKPGQPEPLEKIETAVLTPGGALLVADGKRKRVFRFDRKGVYQQPFPDAKEREVTRMVLDAEGGIVMLDGQEKAVRVFDETGKPLRALGPRGTGWQLQRPVDVAVDPFRNLYVADQEGAVHVLSPQGALLTSITAPEMRKPAALTLDPSGAVLVYDEKAEKILRFK
jgi:TolA-binding protein